jgi:hypothetical protein
MPPEKTMTEVFQERGIDDAGSRLMTHAIDTPCQVCLNALVASGVSVMAGFYREPMRELHITRLCHIGRAAVSGQMLARGVS